MEQENALVEELVRDYKFGLHDAQHLAYLLSRFEANYDDDYDEIIAELIEFERVIDQHYSSDPVMYKDLAFSQKRDRISNKIAHLVMYVDSYRLRLV